jgi:hypothetical protein
VVAQGRSEPLSLRCQLRHPAGGASQAALVRPRRRSASLRGGAGGAQERGVLNPLPGGEDFVANPALPEDILREAVRPGCQAHFFIQADV